MQETLLQMAVALTVGIFAGFVIGGLLTLMRKKKPETAAKKERQVQWMAGKMPYLMYFVFLVLVVGLVWTVYYLLLGLVDPAQTEYATNVSQLIVSVLTVFSIIIAFVEFRRRK